MSRQQKIDSLMIDSLFESGKTLSESAAAAMVDNETIIELGKQKHSIIFGTDYMLINYKKRITIVNSNEFVYKVYKTKKNIIAAIDEVDGLKKFFNDKFCVSSHLSIINHYLNKEV